MKIVKPNVEIMRSGLETEFMTPEQFIERVGRTCYKSEDKITETSAAKFVSNLIKRGHEAMVEHWTLIFKAATPGIYDLIKLDMHRFVEDTTLDIEHPVPHLRFTCKNYGDKHRCIISGNVRAWRDFARITFAGYGLIPPYLRSVMKAYPVFFPEYQDWVQGINNMSSALMPISVSDLRGRKEHSVHHDVTVKFTTDRGISHEIVRHREASYAQESTRYCNYSGDKYGKEISVVEPIDIYNLVNGHQAYDSWADACLDGELGYFNMLSNGCTPQTARSVLPTCTKTEVIMTAPLGEWDHVFGLRCAPDAHPDIQHVMKLARNEFYALFPERYNTEV